MKYRHHDKTGAGWFSGDGHQHIAPGALHGAGGASALAEWCADERLQWMAVCQPWLEAVDWSSTDTVPEFDGGGHAGTRIWMGGEFPKTRFGHTWWLGLQEMTQPLSRYIDHSMEEYYTAEERRAVPEYDGAGMLATWGEYCAAGAVPVHAHPTSWWTANEDERFVTNMAAMLPVYALAGTGPIAMVVMGYDADQVFYQDAWFRLLNRGYRVTAMAESDGQIGDARARFVPGALRTYVWLGQHRQATAAAVADAVARGRTVVSSGPFVEVRVAAGEGYSGPGTVVCADGRRCELQVTVELAPRVQRGLTYVVIYRNGDVYRVYDLRDRRPRRWSGEVEITETTDAWYAVKAYSGSSPCSPDALDVSAFAAQCLETGATPYAGDGEVGLTSPIYFRRDPGRPDPPALACDAVVSVRGTRPAVLEVQDALRNLVARHMPEGDRVECCVPLAGRVVARFANGRTEARSPVEDNPRLSHALAYVYLGGWRRDYPSAQPGQAPAALTDPAHMKAFVAQCEWQCA